MIFNKKNTRFVIFGQGRSGSNLLRTLLSSHPNVSCDVELFNPEKLPKKIGWKKYLLLLFPYQYILQKQMSAKSEVYGFKLFVFHLFQISWLIKKLHAEGWKIIFLKRKNILKQALSADIGLITKSYLRKINMPPPDKTYRIEPEKVSKTIRKIIRGNRQITKILRNKPHLQLYYEDDLADQNNWQKTALRIFKFLDVTPHKVTSKLAITDPRPDWERIENFDQIIAYLKANGHEDVVQDYYKYL
jgi:hypothetical protein